MFERAALIHYHEIGLKGRNRAAFERRLRDNLEFALAHLISGRVERISSRLLARVADASLLDEVCRIAASLPGVSYAAAAYVTSRGSDDMNAAALLAVREVPRARTFAVASRRSNTDHPVTSREMNRIIGQYIVDNTALAVDLSAPDVRCSIEVVQGEAYLFSRKFPGVGGLPIGTAGTVISLLSAGIDSPVATWRLMKRGAVAVGVHFSGRPQTNELSERLVVDIGSTLARSGGLGRIYVVPFGDLQREISLLTTPDLRVLLYRRLMIRVAERFAALEGAKALVTGESLGQVASQTLDNIAAVDDAATLPVLRPLIGTNKLEIIAEARSLGTYELSTQEHADCCTLFMPRTPATHATVAEVRHAETALEVKRMVGAAVSAAEYHDFVCPAYRAPKRLPGVRPAGER
ncbi:MAG: tRNA uracil 4-sulfurtransferase ThiI [Anaerosomatales bacterium]|nr:tRNA 4-thiouridine(8) synthase ThiI [Anaerosomatales bacterium]MDT8433285.1 tRNA uracil 4-sulfurtransferase ThiI [Anaerosomatales bacterium]